MLDQKLQQKLLQKLSPQQIQLIKLLEIPTLELEQRIKKEIEENPALEEGEQEEEVENEENEITDNTEDEEDESEVDTESPKKEDEFSLEDYIADDEDETPYYNLTVNNYSKDEDKKEYIFSAGSSFHESLLTQLGLRFLTPRQVKLAEYLIGNLDDDGYLRRDLSSVVDDLSFLQNIETTEKEMLEILLIVQQLDPPGIAARSLQECLLIQIHKKEHKTDALTHASVILHDYFDEFTKKHYDKIIKKLSIEESELKGAIEEIVRLNPRPGNSYSDSQSKGNNQITPDFVLEQSEGKFYLALNSRNAPELRVSNAFTSMVETFQSKKEKKLKTEKEAITFARQKIEAARWFIDALQQRQNTLMVTMNAILSYQKDFFREGDETVLKPMILKDISDMTGLDISTVSRVANSKYIQTQHGIFPLKFFFSESMQNDMGEEVSTREIKKILQDEIEKENKRNPLTDEELTEVLKTRGYPIARRTVAKYREQLNIPVGRLRKKL